MMGRFELEKIFTNVAEEGSSNYRYHDHPRATVNMAMHFQKGPEKPIRHFANANSSIQKGLSIPGFSCIKKWSAHRSFIQLI
jgi:hypothetical protein